MNPVAAISISREGQELGTWSATDIRKMLASGELAPTDYFWHEGMSAWSTLTDFLLLPSKVETKTEIVPVDLGGTPALNPSAFVDEGKVGIDSGAVKIAGRRKLYVTVVSLVVLLLAAIALVLYIQWKKGPLPTQNNFTRALETVRIIPDSDAIGRIIIADKWNRKIVLEVRSNEAWESPGYKMVATSDQLGIDYDNFVNVASATSADAEIPPVLDRNQQVSLGPPVPSALVVAVDTFVHWSINAVDSQTTEIQRRISGDVFDEYVFQGVQRSNRYLLLYRWMPRLTVEDLNSSNPPPRGKAYPVTDFSRAHLWKYLVDHYDEVQAMAAADYAMMNEAAVRAKEQKAAAVQKAESDERERADRAAKEAAAQKSRLDRLFPVPPGATPGGHQ